MYSILSGSQRGILLCSELSASILVAMGLQLVKNETNIGRAAHTYNKQHDPAGHAEMPG